MVRETQAAKRTARRLLAAWKGQAYIFGLGCLEDAGPATAELGRRAVLVANHSAWMAPAVERLALSLARAGVEVSRRVAGARPNAPREDVYRIQDAIAATGPEVILAIGGGSTIDAAKAAAVLAGLEGTGHDIEPYFGVGKVSAALEKCATGPPPLVALQTAAGSSAHLTKYSNITDLATSQKKLIIDDAIVPAKAVFDYLLTTSAPRGLTLEGAFDGLGHLLEPYFGAGPENIDLLERLVQAGVGLIVGSVMAAVSCPQDASAREALGLGTDLGGYAIMVGSTNGPHLNSFSFVDVLAHGRAVAVLEPYYVVFFAPAIERQLHTLAAIYAGAGLMAGRWEALHGRDLGLAVAEAMLAMARRLGLPTSLAEVPGFTDEHVVRALAAAKNPQLASKLRAMPVALSAGQVDEYMGAVLEAAKAGELSLVRNFPG